MRQSLSCLAGSAAIFLLAAIATRSVQPLYYLSPFYSGQVQFALAATLLAGVSFLLSRRWSVFLLMLIGAAMTAHLPVRVYPFGDMAQAQEAEGRPGLRLLSFNLLNGNMENGPALRDEILNSGADVAALLESRPVQPHLDALAATYPHRLGCGAQTMGCDLMILSKRPFLQKSVGALSELRSERFMHVVIETGGERVNVVAAHLTKPYYDEYHTSELRRLWRRISALEGPLVLAGDFNASSIAPDMMWFLNVTGLRKAPFEPSTWPVALGPLGISIDHIYTRAPLRLSGLRRIGDNHGSNHYGLIADLFISPPAPTR